MGQGAVRGLLPRCRARQLSRGKGNYSRQLRAAKATQRGDCSQQKGYSALQLPTAPSLPHTDYENSKLLMRKYKKSNFPPIFAHNGKNSTMTTQSLTESISITNMEQIRPSSAGEPTEEIAGGPGGKTRILQENGNNLNDLGNGKKQGKFTDFKTYIHRKVQKNSGSLMRVLRG